MKISFKNKRVLVVGLGKSGRAAAALLVSLGANVFATDEKTKEQLGDSLKDFPRSVELETGSSEFFSKPMDLIVVSPGVPGRHPGLVAAKNRGVPIWSELELGWRCARPKKTVAVTGTNGKTTTTAMIGAILKKAGKPTVVGGNIGTPLSALVKKINARTYLVLEVSSYQLEAQETFHPNVGVFTNLTPDHLGRHGSMEGYAAAKQKMFENFSSKDTAVLNANDAWCRNVGARIRGKKVWFPSDDLRALASATPLPGGHNLENAMAAAAAVRALGLSGAAIRAGIKAFKGVPHRIQTVAEKKGVHYVNDSKSTNVDSTFVALKAFERPLILILGGQHKGAPYTPLTALIKKKVKRILTIGEAAAAIAADLNGAAPVESCGTLQCAVARAAEIGERGDTVLLSPACASFDQFKNFEDRGEQFAAIVRALRS